MLYAAGQSSCDRKSKNWFLKVWYGEWLAFHQILAGNVTHMLGTTTKLSIPFQVLGLWLPGVYTSERNVLRKLKCLTATVL